MRIATTSKILKLDDSKRLVLGFAVVCKVNGEEFVDSQGDHIPEEPMFEAAVDFMLNSREAHDMHTGIRDGEVVFMFPLTTEIAKALDIVTPMTGLLIGLRPSPEVYAKFQDGTYTGFSIGGELLE